MITRADFNRDFQAGFDIHRADNEAYQTELQRLVDSQLTEYEEKIRQAKERAQIQFQEDFVSKLQSNIFTVEGQIRDLNAALKGISFGRDQYRFQIIPNVQYIRFYQMIMDELLMEGYGLFSQSFQEKDACDAANMVETETFLLSEIGIEVSHEDIAFCGPIVFQVESEPNLGGNSKSQIGDDISSQLDCSAFPFGLALDAEVLDRLWILELPVKRIVSIENRTNYRHYIRHERKPDELVIYLGGFPSPGKRRFLYKLAEFSQLHLNDTDHDHAKAPVFHHWGDLDYGGILICQTLRDSVWPKVQPWRMEPRWVDDLMQFVEPFDEEYRARLEGLLLNPRYCLWKPLIQKLIEVGGTLEQEAFLV